MSSRTTYLITGANRGIGLGLTRSLLLRPDTTVIATIRSLSTSTTDLEALRKAESSHLIVLPLACDDPASYPTLAAALQEEGIEHIDILIANAGTSTAFSPALTTLPAALLYDFQTNTLGPVLLFQTLHHLLQESEKTGGAKFVVISSSLGSIGDMEPVPCLSYGVSKAGVNFLVRKVHFEHKGVVSLAVHPGWVKTANGQNFADSIGVAEPPLELEESVQGVLNQIDEATKSTTSGTFISYDGTTILW